MGDVLGHGGYNAGHVTGLFFKAAGLYRAAAADNGAGRCAEESAILRVGNHARTGPFALCFEGYYLRCSGRTPDRSNWSEYPNIRLEVEGHLCGCEWFQVYDIVERIWKAFKERDDGWYDDEDKKAVKFQQAMNDFFIRKGIGWQLVDGAIVTRGAEAFEETIKAARRTLEEGGRPTASKHIHEALQDLSRRPAPDLPGAIFHAMGCLECVARDVTGNEKATLGDILKKQKGLVPPPLDAALEKAWGYASNEARHVWKGGNRRGRKRSFWSGWRLRWRRI
jgi:hypothetical protein